MFTSDRPITSLEDDLIGRKPFAERLSDAILAWQDTDSLVIALYGAWGSGKTSVLNLVIDQIESQTAALAGDKQPIIIRFNPWQFDDQSHLLLLFYDQLLAQIRTKEEKIYDAVKDKIAEYGTLVSSAASLPLLRAVPGLAEILDMLGLAAKMLADPADAVKLRKEIDNAFHELERRLIIVIDDIDRLRKEDIRSLFQLIKLNADFPNTIYVLAADRAVIEASLENEQGISGRDYLEKIVQVGFDLPAIDRSAIETILKQAIENSMGDCDLSLWDQTRWSYLFNSGLKSLFTTIRAVKRFANSLSLNISMVTDEVNPIDFIGIEAIRVFEPGAYSATAQNKMMLCRAKRDDGLGQYSMLFAKKLDNAELKDECERMLEKASEKNRESMRRILVELFPAMREAYPNINTSQDYRRTDDRRLRRICSVEVFESYFILGTPSGEIPRAELISLKNTANSESQDELNELLIAYVEDGRILRLLETSNDIHGELTSQGAKLLANAIVETSDEIAVDEAQNTSVPTHRLIRDCILELFALVESTHRGEWLQTRLTEQRGLYYLVSIVSTQRNEDDSVLKDNALLDEATTCELEALCVGRFRSLAETGTFMAEINPGYLLSRWRLWEREQDRIEQFVQATVSELSSALEFIGQFTVTRYQGDDQDALYIRINDIGAFADAELIDKTLRSVLEADSQDLTEDQKLLLVAWDRSYPREEEQHPDA